MFSIRTYNLIAERGLSLFPKEQYKINSQKRADAILLRSENITSHSFDEDLLAVARAGAGVNNIPVKRCTEKGIVVFNTPGANANAVKELVIGSLIACVRKIADSRSYVEKLSVDCELQKEIEANKKLFVGSELRGKKIGIFGLGHIGVLVANACKFLEMEVYGYDPFISVDSAWNLSRSIYKASSAHEMLSQCDFISLHVPLNEATRYSFNHEILTSLKDHCILLNFSRAELVDHRALKESLERGKISYYISDFPVKELLSVPRVIFTPHIGASTKESEENCAVMAVSALRNYLEFGNIKHSVNFPDCEIPYSGKKRILILNRNVPRIIHQITECLGRENINIDNMINKSKDTVAATIIDIDGEINDHVYKELLTIDGVLRVRFI